jgi:DNA-binding CsgD family transcriptional regulator
MLPMVYARSVPPSLDPIAVIESGYQTAATPEQWWKHVAQAVAPMLDRGHGMYAYSMRLDELRPREFVDLGAARESMESTIRGATQNRQRAALHAIDPVGLFSSRAVFDEPDFIVPGIVDGFALSVPDGEGSLHVLAAPSAEVLSVTDEDAQIWKRLALHLGAGIRLRRQAGTLDDPEIEAVLSPDGALLHADAEHTDPVSREQLRDIARQIDRVRTHRGRDDVHGAMEVWQGLLLGRWSLVDHFDTDGRRFLVARRNDPDAPAPRQLTRRQRQVVFYASLALANKQIGYVLGLAETTVATHLALALEKLGIATREELIHVVADAMRIERTP